MNTESRISNSIKNSIFGIIVQVSNVLLGFVIRTVFVKCLSAEYLGINGLFTNVLTMLSLAELGVGSAIVYNMYKPISENDTIKIAKLMNLYRDAYRIIGCVVALIGLCLVPFLDYIIKDQPDIDGLTVIYLLFLGNTVSSYFFAYKRSMFSADQKERTLHKFKLMFYVIRSIGQIIVLITFKNFILYLLIQILCTIFENICVAIRVDINYPFLKKYKREHISKEERKSIFDDIKALFIYKIGGTILDGTDNIILSSFVGVVWVGKLSNYTLITGSLSMLLNQITSSVTASVGNFIAQEKESKYEDLLNRITFVNFVFYGLSTVCIITLINPFIELWVGDQYLLDFLTAFVLGTNFYIVGMMNAVWTFRSTMGLFVYGKWRPIVSAIINVIVSIWWAKSMGLVGVLLGTTFTRLVTNVWYDPLVVYKYGLHKKPYKYFLRLILYFIIMIVVIFATEYIGDLLHISGIIEIVVKLIFSCCIFGLITVITFKKSDEWNYFENIIHYLINR